VFTLNNFKNKQSEKNTHRNHCQELLEYALGHIQLVEQMAKQQPEQPVEHALMAIAQQVVQGSQFGSQVLHIQFGYVYVAQIGTQIACFLSMLPGPPSCCCC
jgi:hypothetical protein